MLDEADVCKVFVYTDKTDLFRWPPRVNRHNGFVFTLETESGKHIETFRIDYNMHNDYEKGFVSVARKAPRNAREQRLLAVVNLKRTEEKEALYKIWSRMFREYQVYYDFRHVQHNCRGYVLRHIETVADALNVPDTLKSDSVKLVRGSVDVDRYWLAIPGMAHFLTTAAIVPSARATMFSHDHMHHTAVDVSFAPRASVPQASQPA